MGIAARSEIPKEVYKKLADTFEKVAKDPKVMAQLETLGYKPEYTNGTDFLALLKRDYEKVRKIAKEAGMISQWISALVEG